MEDDAAVSEDSMLSLYECPVCMDSVVPPILQCRNGHLLCSSCRKNVLRCAVCRDGLVDVRNLSLEKLAHKVKFPCKFKTVGCTAVLSAPGKHPHEYRCPFRTIECPFPSGQCPWSGSTNEVKDHLINNHPFVSSFQGEEMLLCVKADAADDACYWIRLQLCFGCEFLVFLRRQHVGDDKWRYCAVMQMIAWDEASDMFAYHLEFYGPNGRQAFEGMPLGIGDSADVALDNGDCLAFEISDDQIELCGGSVRIRSTVTDLS